MKVIYYYHIPKCGGTFIAGNLKRLSTNLENSVMYTFNNLKGGGEVTNVNRNKLKGFLKTLSTLKYDYVFIHHHHRQCGLKELLPNLKECSKQISESGDEFYMFTCVRETVSFATSAVNYGIQSGYKKPSKHNFNFSNNQSNYLLYNSSYWVNDYDVLIPEVREILDFMNKIYTTENITQIKLDLKNLINENIDWNDNKVNVSKKLIIPTEEEKKLLIDNNKIDIWMHEYAKKTNM